MAQRKVTYDLVRGNLGADVARLQRALNAAQGLQLVVDGVYGVNTFNAIRQLQAQHGIAVDGQCSGATLTKVRDLGYAAVEFLVGDGNEGLNWPKKPGPAALAQPNATLTSSMFGEFEFEAAPTPDNPEAIRIKGGWESDNIVTVTIPQLVGVPIPISAAHATLSNGRIRCHKLAKDKFLKVFAAWDAAGLANRILTFDGSFNARLMRGTRTPVKANLSNHSWGATIDLNADLNPQRQVPVLMGGRGCLRELAVVAIESGVYWGGHFGKSDGMHFEVARLP